jgi:hypothetical protein
MLKHREVGGTRCGSPALCHLQQLPQQGPVKFREERSSRRPSNGYNQALEKEF